MISRLFRFSHYAFHPLAIPVFLTAATMFLLGTAVLFREQFSKISGSFFLMTLVCAVWLFGFGWMYSATDEKTALGWAKFAYIGVPLIPGIIYSFTVAVLGISKQRGKWVWIALMISELFSIAAITTDWLVAGLYQYGWGYYPRYGWLSFPYLIFFFGVMAINLWEYRLAYQKVATERNKQRIRFFVLAFSIAYIGSVDYLAKFGIPVYPFGYIPILGFAFVLAYTIQRYRLIEITPEFAATHILETMYGAVFVTDPAGNIRVINRAACEMLGVREHEVETMPIEQVTGGSFSKSSEAFRDRFMIWKTKAGKKIEVIVSSSFLHAKDHSLVGIVYVAIDVTELRRAQEELRKLNETLEQRVQDRTRELKRSNEELERFAYIASHDLQEPLRMVTSYVQLLKERYQKKLGEDAQEFISYAVEGASRSQQLINDLLEYSRVRLEKESFVMTDIQTVLEKTVANLKVAIEETGAEISHDPLPTVPADEIRLVQLFQNLIGNALKFRHQGRKLHVHISACENEHEWIFSVKDNGIGIDPQYQERIFVIFQRLHSRSEYPGTGIGLAICKKIVESHHGRIWVESEPGKGSTFYFSLPKN